MSDKIKRDGKGRIKKGVAQNTNKNGTAGRPTVMTEDVIRELKRAFEKSFTDIEACLDVGISTTALYDYCNKNPEFAERKEELKKMPNLEAKLVWQDKINSGDYKAAKEWLERKSADEFSMKTKVDANVKNETVVDIASLEDET